jgi:hypothetical protein
MPTLPPEWLKTTLEITGDFETAGNPWAGISDDFDEQGISCGILQWNIGQGSLQPLVKACGSAVVHGKMPVHGEELWQACHKPVSKGLAIVRAWQPNGGLKPVVLKELRALFGSDEMVLQQINFSKSVGQKAFNLATSWASDLRDADQPSLKEFCWFFDLVTQSGDMKGIWLDDVKNFINENDRDKSSAVICDWMSNRPSTVQHRGDGKKNATLWRNSVENEDLELFILTYLRSLKSKVIYQLVTMNRRGTITNTRGWVNGELNDLVKLRTGPND